MNGFTSLSGVLDELAPAVTVETPDWDDVLLRVRLAEAAEPEGAPRRRQPRLLALAAAFAVAVAAVAAALAAGGLHRFTAWLSGAPGRPAPASDQAGFAQRNAAAFARFPADTRLRLLVRAEAGGKTFNLLGFRNADSLCLRVVRADLPAGRGSTQCASLTELEQAVAPAVVVSDVWFRFGKPGMSADGVYGFADDTVQSIDVIRERSGTQRVQVASNAFVALVARRAGSVAKHPAPDPITGVFAVRRDGTRNRLPYIAGGGVTAQTAPPAPPFYLAADRTSPNQIPGPTKVGRQFTGGTVGWVFARQPRGDAFVVTRRERMHIGTVLFARSVQPDPRRPDRVAFMLVKLAPRSFGPKVPSEPVLCFSALQPLDRLTGMSCAGVSGGSPSRPFRADNPVVVSFMWPSQISHLVGIAADEVASVKIFLANGRVIPAAVRDNAVIADVPQSTAAKVVAYDSRGRVIGVSLLPNASMHYQPCPAYVPPTRPIPAARPFERVDLETGALNGHRIIGATESEVVAALGRPDRIRHNTVINGVRIPDYIYGGTRPGPHTTQIQFGKDGDRIVAVSMMFQTNRLTDTRLGRVLAVDPSVLQRKIRHAYPSYTLTSGYGTLDAHGCQFVFNRGRFASHLMLSVYLVPQRPSLLTLVLRNGY